MGKVNELLQLIEELNRCGNTLIDISEELKNLFSGSEEDSRKTEAKTKTAEKASKEEKTISLEDVAICRRLPMENLLAASPEQRMILKLMTMMISYLK